MVLVVNSLGDGKAAVYVLEFITFIVLLVSEELNILSIFFIPYKDSVLLVDRYLAFYEDNLSTFLHLGVDYEVKESL